MALIYPASSEVPEDSLGTPAVFVDKDYLCGAPACRLYPDAPRASEEVEEPLAGHIGKYVE